MKRRDFFGTTIAAGMGGLLFSSCGKIRDNLRGGNEPPGFIAGLPLDRLREDYRVRLFDRWLPFWLAGGVDAERGGFRDILSDDGAVVTDEKSLLVQGQGLWVFSTLYADFGNNEEYLAIARKARDFLVAHFDAGNGAWHRRTAGDGTVLEQAGTGTEDVLGWLAVAEGLAAFHRAAGEADDQRRFIETIWAAIRAYDSQEFGPSPYLGILPPDVALTGARSLAVTARLIRTFSQYFVKNRNRKFDEILGEHIEHANTHFFNPRVGVSNCYLRYDYSRFPGYEDHMHTGIAVDALDALAFEAMRTEDNTMLGETATLLRRYLEIGWDTVFDGFGGGVYYVFDGPDRTRDKLYGLKAVQPHAQLLTVLQHIAEYTWEPWAIEWNERLYTYVTSKLDTGKGIWRTTVNRFGSPILSGTAESLHRDIFYQPRCLMLNLRSVERMLDEEAAAATIEPAPPTGLPGK